MDEATKAAAERMAAAQRKMQSGVAGESGLAQHRGERDRPTEPKHLRVGVNTALVEVGALARLLITKGVFTELEYFTAMAEGHEAEVAAYERRLSEAYGRKVTLGGTLEDIGG